jgi:hypothetical protein
MTTGRLGTTGCITHTTAPDSVSERCERTIAAVRFSSAPALTELDGPTPLVAMFVTGAGG